MFKVTIDLDVKYTGAEVIQALETASAIQVSEGEVWGVSVWALDNYANRDGKYIPLSQTIIIHPFIQKRRKKYLFWGKVKESLERKLNPTISLEFSNIEEPLKEITFTIDYVWTIHCKEAIHHFSISSPDDSNYQEKVRPYFERVTKNLLEKLKVLRQ